MTLIHTYVLYCDGKGGEPGEPCPCMLEVQSKSTLRAWMRREKWRDEYEGEEIRHYCPRCQGLERMPG